ncbi:TolC family protein [Lacihabitans soyangensis]|uniref:TolC family protein n=1 Tax=Lacihabitans soyangensis TaxID=869394 RepID=A0AAE3H976_9BACT|nr:TolC family protein [Lacihabitans soyangensis]MCP9765900.1 TolC family protein [Lacihabitans soyangensis]
MKKLLIYLCFLIGNNAFGQAYSLKKCIEVAIKNNPTFQRAYLNAELANANSADAKSRNIPQVQAYFSQGMNFGRSIDRFSNDYINQLYNSTYGSLQMNMPIYKGFQTKNLVESTKLLQQAETQNLEADKNSLSINLLKAYLDVLASKELLSAARKQLENSEIQLARQEKMMAAGTSGKLEQLQFSNQATADKGNLIDAKYNYQIARLALFQLMNIKPNDSIDFEAIVPYEIGQAPLVDFTANPVEFLPEYKSFELQSLSFDRRIKANKAENSPSVNLSGNYSTFYASSNPERTFFQQVNDTRNGSFSLNLAIPIFSKFQTSPRTQQLAVQKKMLDNTRKVKENTLQQEVESAILMLKAMGERYQNATQQVEISKENLKLVELRIEAGTINPIEFSLAQANLERAVSNQIQTKFRWILQKKLLGYYQTGEFDFL